MKQLYDNRSFCFQSKIYHLPEPFCRNNKGPLSDRPVVTAVLNEVEKMIIPDASNRRKGHYLGTEIDEKWWKRYKKNKLFARGNGEYWIDDTALYFRRYLTKLSIIIPFPKIIEIKIGKSHAGRWLLGSRVIKLIWEKGDMKLSSGFIISRNQQETEMVMADFIRRRDSACRT